VASTLFRNDMKKTVFISGSLIGILVILAAIWLSIAGPVLVEWHYGINFGAICDPPIVILNPLRNREYERVADRFLAELKNGNITILDELISDQERLEHIRLREIELKILSWFAAGRKEGSAEATVEYWIERKYDEGCHTVPAGITLTRIDQQWKVTSYNPIY
jgi:hypothetical protein